MRLIRGMQAVATGLLITMLFMIYILRPLALYIFMPAFIAILAISISGLIKRDLRMIASACGGLLFMVISLGNDISSHQPGTIACTILFISYVELSYGAIRVAELVQREDSNLVVLNLPLVLRRYLMMLTTVIMIAALFVLVVFNLNNIIWYPQLKDSLELNSVYGLLGPMMLIFLPLWGIKTFMRR